MKLVERAKAIWKLVRGGGLSKTDKWILALSVLYCLSPVDLIPDFVPVLGLLDDLLVVLLALRQLDRKAAPAKTGDAIPVDVKVI